MTYASASQLSTLLLTALSIFIATTATVGGQRNNPCTVSMMTSFTPCFNFITGSTGNANSPTHDCCDSLNTLMTTSLDCTCLVISANIPFPLTINRTLAVTLPRLCNTGGVGIPIQCKASQAVASTEISTSPVAAPRDAPIQQKGAPMTQGDLPPVLALPSSTSTTPAFVPSIKPLQTIILVITSIVILFT